MKSLLLLLLVMAVVMLGLLFSMENTTLVSLNVLVAELPEQRLSTWVILSFFVGGLCGMLSASFVLIRLQASRLRLLRNVKRASPERQA
ncbi:MULTISPECIES: lipopolysaccharide assembly protein LapA domain-containing protein [Spongiibacter]|uniref:lipopolysaccharide assembly protein LapA domain-containing protein n=1 Tax=Spongiibacter TaxID=630749 RepID=UPI0023542292|nr:MULTISPECIES: lipopolysaccharide assembly protein LapA domain-containing protein [Spongiibacter]